MSNPLIDWNDAFDNSSYVPGANQLAQDWSTAAQCFRDRLGARATLDMPYGATHREKFDYFRPQGSPIGTVIFIHGGYWQLFDKSTWSHFAGGSLNRGWAVAIPSYTLAPAASLSEIGVQLASAIQTISSLTSGAIRLVGHSAGGHLVARMICQDSPLPDDIKCRVTGVVAISGIYDLRPLLSTEMNATLKLSADTATAESPVFHRPIDCPFTAWVGAQERPEFLRQTRLITEIWLRETSNLEYIRDVYEPGQHHFSVIDGLQYANSALMDALLAPTS